MPVQAIHGTLTSSPRLIFTASWNLSWKLTAVALIRIGLANVKTACATDTGTRNRARESMVYFVHPSLAQSTVVKHAVPTANHATSAKTIASN